MCIYLYTYIHVCLHIFGNINTYVCLICVFMAVHTQIACVPTYMYAYSIKTYTCMYVLSVYVHVYMSAYIHTYVCLPTHIPQYLH